MFYEIIIPSIKLFVGWLFGLTNIFIGFVFGLLSSYFFYWHQIRIKKRRFCITVRSELKQLLGQILQNMMDPDANINMDKARLYLNSHKQFSLINERIHFPDEAIKQKLQYPAENEEDMKPTLKAFIDNHELKMNERKTNFNMMPRLKIKCEYISGNLEIIGLLKRNYISCFINIINRVHFLNGFIEQVNSCFHYTFTGNLSQVNSERNRQNYYSTCQLISDNSYQLVKEIVGLLKLLEDKNNCL